MQYRTVEGELGAINVLTNLTTFGAETGVGPIKVPAGSTRLAGFWSTLGAHVDTAGDNCSVQLRLGGKGMRNGDQDFTLYGAGGGVTNTGTAVVGAQWLPLDLEVVPNELINVAVVATGDDVLIGTVGITLAFA